MSRLRRFPDNRFIGRRDKMIVYDCEADEEYALLSASVESEGLDQRNLLQAFAPDSEDEAANRGFQTYITTRRDRFADETPGSEAEPLKVD